MSLGHIAGTIDFAQVCLYVFWAFFVYLIFYIRKEDRREGYPLMAEPDGQKPQGFFFIPSPKTFHLPHGGTVQAPDFKLEEREMKIEKREVWPGAPFVPTGDPMVDGVGPASWAERADTPDMTAEGHVKIVPLRVATDFAPAEGELDPRGLDVVAGDGETVGKVADLWVDRAESLIRYIEVDLTGGKALVPMTLALVKKPVGRAAGSVQVQSIYGKHFPGVPGLANPDQITLLEEEKVMAYFAGGTLYADPERAEPIL